MHQIGFDLEPGVGRALDHACGYRVYAGRRRLGVVEGVEPSDGALFLRTRDGLGLALVPYDVVAFVDPHEQRVVLRRRP